MPARRAPSQSARRRYLLGRRAEWDELGALDRAVSPGSLTLAQGDALVSGYRQLARDVATARASQPGTQLVVRLEALYRRVHRRLHLPFAPLRVQLASVYGTEVPAATRRLLPALRSVLLIFAGAIAVGAVTITAFPELIALFASEEMISGVQKGHLWTQGMLNVLPSSVVAARIATNNIAVTLAAYVLGTLYGLGTLYLIGLNGLMLGAMLAYTAQFGLAGELLRFTTAHGPTEISIVLIAGAAGLRLGEALARPGQQRRAEAFRDVVAYTGSLFMVCLPFLVLCGLVEGFVSPDPSFPDASRATIGAGLAVLLWSAMFGRLRLNAASRPQSQVLVDEQPLETGDGR